MISGTDVGEPLHPKVRVVFLKQFLVDSNTCRILNQIIKDTVKSYLRDNNSPP